jgi:hypothetical protein
MRKAFGALEANAVIERLARDNSQRRDTFAQLYGRFNETKHAARGLQRQVQDQQSELDQLRSQNAFLVDKMVPLKNLVTNYEDLNSQLQVWPLDSAISVPHASFLSLQTVGVHPSEFIAAVLQRMLCMGSMASFTAKGSMPASLSVWQKKRWWSLYLHNYPL